MASGPVIEMVSKSERREEDRKRARWLRDLSTLERRVVSRPHALIAFILVIVMLASSFAVLSLNGNSGQPAAGPQASHSFGSASTDPSASVNVAASYYTLASESNTQYTFQVPLCDNG